MNYLILINKQGKPVVIEVPERTDHPITPHSYNLELQSAIADESKHIPLKDWVAVGMILFAEEVVNTPLNSVLSKRVGQTFQIPEGYSLRLYKTCKWHGNKDSCGNEICWDLDECQKSPELKYAILEKTSDRVDPKPTAVAEPVKFKKCEKWCADCKAFDWSTCEGKPVK